MISVYLLLDYPPFKTIVFPLLALSFFTRFYPFPFLLFYLFIFLPLKKGNWIFHFSLFTLHSSLFTLHSSLFT